MALACTSGTWRKRPACASCITIRATPGRYFVESAPGGLAVFDYNGDGRPDIFFTNGADTPSLEKTLRRVRKPPLPQRRADAVHGRDRRRRRAGRRVCDGRGSRRTTTTTATSISSWRASGRTSCCATAATAASKTSRRRSGIASGDWAVAAGWFDYDNDGRLDLMVVNYVQVVAGHEPLLRRSGSRDRASTAIRASFQGLPNRLYRNRGDGTFEDVSARAGLLDAHRQGHERRVRGLRPRRPSRHVRHRTTRSPTSCSTTTATARSRKRRCSPASRCPTPAGRCRAWAPTFRTTTTTGGRTSTSPRLPARRSRSSGTTATARSSRRRRRAGWRPLTVKSSGWCTVFADVDNDGWKDIFTANSHVNDRIGDFAVDRSGSSPTASSSSGQVTATPADSATRRRKPVSPALSRCTGDAAWPTSTATAASTSSCWSLGGQAELWKNDSARRTITG